MGAGSWKLDKTKVPNYCPIILFTEISVEIHDSARIPALEANMDNYMQTDEYKDAIAKKARDLK